LCVDGYVNGEMEKGKMNKFLAITQYASAVFDRTLFIHFS